VNRIFLTVAAIVLTGAPAPADPIQDCDAKTGEIAIQGCTELMRSSPREASAYYNRGMAYLHMENLDRAIADFTKAIEFDPRHADAYTGRGQALRGKGALDRAIADHSKAIEIDPQHADAYNDRGLAYRSKGELDRAIADYTKAAEIDPQHADAYNNRGNAYGAKGDYDRTIADYARAIELDPTVSAYARSLGIARYGRGEFAGAAVALLRAVELEDDAYAMLFRYLARSRAGEKAAAELEANARRLISKQWPYAVTELYLGRRSTEATLDAADEADDRCEAHFYIGQWHLLKGSPAPARAAFEHAAKTCPQTFIEYEVAVAELKRMKR
jgi:tetratricopeptide (TPR) repeat protein